MLYITSKSTRVDIYYTVFFLLLCTGDNGEQEDFYVKYFILPTDSNQRR